MAEGEIVVSALREEGCDVGMGTGVGRGDGEEERDGGEERAERDEQPAVPGERAARGGGGWVAVGAGEEAAGHQSEGGDRGEGEYSWRAEKVKKTRTRPAQRRRVRAVWRSHRHSCRGETDEINGAPGSSSPLRARCGTQFRFEIVVRDAEVADVAEDCGGEEGRPGKEPEGGEEPEEEDGDLAVVVGDAARQEAGDVLVVEIEPGPACAGGQAEAGGHRDGWIAQRGEDVPGGGDRRKTSVDGMRWSLRRSRSWRVRAR